MREFCGLNLYFVTVIIPTYKDWDQLKLCLASLANQSYPAELYEIIVVNNDPNDFITEIKLPDNFNIVNEAKPGSYAARNKAISVAKGDVFAFTDSDCIPNSDWIEKALEHLVAGAERVAGHVELFYRSQNLTYAETFEKIFAFNQRDNAGKGGSVTANMITWRKNFDKVGLFNDMLLSGGDLEWGARAKAIGIPIKYAPDVIVKHPARWNMRQLKSKAKRTTGGAVSDPTYFEEYHFTWCVRGFMPPIKIILGLVGREDLSLGEIFIAGIIAYFLKVYSNIQKIKLRIGIDKPERV